MNENLGSVVMEEKIINLDTATMEELKEHLNQIEDKENMLKQEIDNMLNSMF